MHLSFAPTARAVDGATRGAARALGTEGVEAYLAGDFNTAVSKLEKAYVALPAPSLALWSARALEKTGRLVEASERYLEATRADLEKGGDRRVQEKAQADAVKERDDLLQKIPLLTIVVDGEAAEGAQLSINGVPLSPALIGSPVPTNPGKITVLAQSQGIEAIESITLAEGERISITLILGHAATQEDVPAVNERPAKEVENHVPADPPGSSINWKMWGWIGTGAGAAGIVAGSVLGALAVSRHKALGCGEPEGCTGSRDDVAQLNRFRGASTASLVVGGVLATAGVTLLVFPPQKWGSAEISSTLGLGSLHLRGTF